MRSEEEEGALRQVTVDVPRTAPGVPFFHQPEVQKSLERILYIWGLRHPASGYVQVDAVLSFLLGAVRCAVCGQSRPGFGRLAGCRQGTVKWGGICKHWVKCSAPSD